MSIKSKMLAAAALLTLAGGLSAAGTVAASAATPQCGSNCLTPKSAAYAGFVETVLLCVPLRGVPTIVSPAVGWNPGEDFIVPAGGPMPGNRFSPGTGSTTLYCERPLVDAVPEPASADFRVAQARRLRALVPPAPGRRDERNCAVTR
jgi:hypothetical protein